MPELPEVESTVLRMRPILVGESFSKIYMHWKKSWSDHGDSHHDVIGKSIQSISRRGKYIILSLEKGELLIHLRMSGRIDIDTESSQHHRVTFEMKSGLKWHLRDTRKFRRIYFVSCSQKIVGHLGPEPLEQNLTANSLMNQLRSSRRAIKTVLLDQRVIAGLGNIYVDEVLWLSKIHPHQAVSSISVSDAQMLLKNIRLTLQKAIALHGTNFGDSVVKDGLYTPSVYGRTGDACLHCGEKIIRIITGGRGTHLCPKCQQNKL